MNEEDQIRTELHMARLQNMKDGGQTAKKSPRPAASLLSFRQKLSEHWGILAVAGFFDLLALIPFVSIVTNPAFGLVLFLNFGPKSKKGSELLKIGLPTAAGTVLDTISSVIPFADLMPFNIGVALLRIALD